MNRDRGSAEEMLRRVALDYWFDEQQGEGERSSRGAPQSQRIALNVYETEEDVVLVAPMPGIEADNVDIQIAGSTVTLRASLRGPGQADRRYLLHEWTYGPYERTVTLPVDVDAEHANATHGNGVLVLSLPKASRARVVRVPLHQAGSSEATHQGHSGHHTSRKGLQGD